MAAPRSWLQRRILQWRSEFSNAGCFGSDPIAHPLPTHCPLIAHSLSTHCPPAHCTFVAPHPHAASCCVPTLCTAVPHPPPFKGSRQLDPRPQGSRVAELLRRGPADRPGYLVREFAWHSHHEAAGLVRGVGPPPARSLSPRHAGYRAGLPPTHAPVGKLVACPKVASTRTPVHGSSRPQVPAATPQQGGRRGPGRGVLPASTAASLRPLIAHSLSTHCPLIAHSLPTHCPRIAQLVPAQCPLIIALHCPPYMLPTHCPP